jgi:hypothetical protein
LLPQGKIFEGELAVTAAEEGEEREQVEQEGDHRARFSLDESRLINQLAVDGVLSKDRSVAETVAETREKPAPPSHPNTEFSTTVAVR